MGDTSGGYAFCSVLNIITVVHKSQQIYEEPAEQNGSFLSNIYETLSSSMDDNAPSGLLATDVLI